MFFQQACLLFLATLSLLSSCSPVSQPQSAPSPRSLASDERLLKNIENHEEALEKDFRDFARQDGWRERGYFNAAESRHCEQLLLRLHTTHHQLLDLADYYANVTEPEIPDRPQRLRAQSHQLALRQAHILVDIFQSDPVAIRQLNQSYPRSEIPRHTYDHLAENLASAPARAAALLRDDLSDAWVDSSYHVQAALFFRVSRMGSPFRHLARFSPAQKDRLRDLLKPGDLIFTYTAGYASDVFIPGAFKHGITYVGTVEDRLAMELPSALDQVVGTSKEREAVRRALQQSRTRSAQPADLIEAVAEGVKFSNLNHLLDTHVNRLVVIRPRLSATERRSQLITVFSLLGEPYDFRFDFADSSRQVCTEVIYRSLEGRRGLAFPLTERGGHLSLSADDLLRYWLDEKPQHFSFVVLAEEAPFSPLHRARLLEGEEGYQRLKELLE